MLTFVQGVIAAFCTRCCTKPSTTYHIQWSLFPSKINSVFARMVPQYQYPLFFHLQLYLQQTGDQASWTSVCMIVWFVSAFCITCSFWPQRMLQLVELFWSLGDMRYDWHRKWCRICPPCKVGSSQFPPLMQCLQASALLEAVIVASGCTERCGLGLGGKRQD